MFTLYDTFGFPVELSTEEAKMQGISLSPDWRAEFDEKMAEQRQRSQQASKMKISTRPSGIRLQTRSIRRDRQQ